MALLAISRRSAPHSMTPCRIDASIAAISSARRDNSSSAWVNGVMSVTTLMKPPCGSGAVRTSTTVPFGRRRRRICGLVTSNAACWAAISSGFPGAVLAGLGAAADDVEAVIAHGERRAGHRLEYRSG